MSEDFKVPLPYDKVKIRLIKELTFTYTNLYGMKSTYKRSFPVSESETFFDNAHLNALARDKGWLEKYADQLKGAGVSMDYKMLLRNIGNLLNVMASVIEEDKYMTGDVEKAFREVCKACAIEPKYSEYNAQKAKDARFDQIRKQVQEEQKKEKSKK